jgi:hypothetical protein
MFKTRGQTNLRDSTLVVNSTTRGLFCFQIKSWEDANNLIHRNLRFECARRYGKTHSALWGRVVDRSECVSCVHRYDLTEGGPQSPS